MAHRIAYHVLRPVAGVQPGQELVVLGAGNGVGLAAVRLGVILGATVTAVASSGEKLETAAEQGATRPSTIGPASSATSSVTHCLTALTSSSIWSVAHWPSRRLARCGGAAGVGSPRHGLADHRRG